MPSKTPHASPTPSLLDSLSIWTDTPEIAYLSWIKSQRLKPSSKVVYQAMFGRFCQWLDERNIRLDQCQASHLNDFLNTKNPNLHGSRKEEVQDSRQRYQYVRMIERVFAHLGTLGLPLTVNPGQQARIEKIGRGLDKPTRFLSVKERQAVIALVETKIEELRKDEKRIDRWIDYRDLALIGATLGAGMKLHHLSGLTLNCIRIGEGVIDNSSEAHSHRAVLLPFARTTIEAWIQVLEELCAVSERANEARAKWLKSQLVFIADRTTNGFGRLSSTRRMHHSSLFRRIKSFLEEAGIAGERASAQTLRNTYASMLVEGGASDAELVTCLGLSSDITVQRLRDMLAGKRPLPRKTSTVLLPEASGIDQAASSATGAAQGRG